MSATKGLTFEEGCNKYLEYCRQRNLREGTIKHYRQSYGYFYKYFDKDMKVVGVNDVKLDTIEKTKIVCNDYQVSVEHIGFETVVKLQ